MYFVYIFVILRQKPIALVVYCRRSPLSRYSDEVLSSILAVKGIVFSFYSDTMCVTIMAGGGIIIFGSKAPVTFLRVNNRPPQSLNDCLRAFLLHASLWIPVSTLKTFLCLSVGCLPIHGHVHGSVDTPLGYVAMYSRLPDLQG